MLTSLSDIDAVLVRYADTLSPAQISFKINGALSPQQVMTRIGQLLEAPDWLTATQQDQLVTMKMRQLVVELEEMPRTSRNAEIIIRALEAVGHRLDKRAEATAADLSTLYAFQGSVMLDAIEKALDHMKKALTASSSIDPATWDAALSQGLRIAQMEVSSHEHVEPELDPLPLPPSTSAPTPTSTSTPKKKVVKK